MLSIDERIDRIRLSLLRHYCRACQAWHVKRSRLCVRYQEEDKMIISNDGYADGGEPYTDEELDAIQRQRQAIKDTFRGMEG